MSNHEINNSLKTSSEVTSVTTDTLKYKFAHVNVMIVYMNVDLFLPKFASTGLDLRSTTDIICHITLIAFSIINVWN